MENRLGQCPTTKKTKSKYWKFILGFFGVIIGVFVLYTAGYWAVYYYKQWQGQKAVQKLAEELEKIKKEKYEQAMADTYGGKTPQETLQMFIGAVEKGDYDLASKYFIEKYQEKELNFLKSLNNDQLNWFLTKMLKGAIKGSIENLGDEEFYTIRVPADKPNTYYAVINFSKYPNGIWKIIKIMPESF